MKTQLNQLLCHKSYFGTSVIQSMWFFCRNTPFLCSWKAAKHKIILMSLGLCSYFFTGWLYVIFQGSFLNSLTVKALKKAKNNNDANGRVYKGKCIIQKLSCVDWFCFANTALLHCVAGKVGRIPRMIHLFGTTFRVDKKGYSISLYNLYFKRNYSKHTFKYGNPNFYLHNNDQNEQNEQTELDLK